jgi:acyl transferase domain-containing protein
VEWENRKYPLRAGVSSFGIGGTNAHVVLEEWPTAQSAERMAQGTGSQGRGGVSPPSSSRRYQLILLSAKTETALDRMTRNLAHHFKKNPGIELADAAYTLQVGRKAFLYRRMLMSPDTVSSIDILESAARSDTPGTTHDKRIQTYISKQDKRPIFMFPGQGSQYINMALELYQSETVFKQETDRCLEILKPLTGYDIKEILYPGIPVSKTVINQKLLWGVPDASRGGFLEKSPPGRRRQEITQTEIAQPVIFVIEYALAKLLMHWGIKPYAMIGHSIGEYTAACLAGVFSLEDALKLVTIRGKLMRQLPKGAMLSIPLPEQELIPLLNSNSELSLAAVNSFSHCVVSGPPPVIEAFARQMKEQGYDTRLLHTSHAFHSKMMDPIVEASG